MKTCQYIFSFIIVVGVLTILSFNVFSTGSVPVEGAVTTYFNALQTGDVNQLKKMIAEPLLSKKRLLLEKNTAYPEHLRNYYQDAQLKISDIIRIDDNTRTADVTIIFTGDANPLKLRIMLKYSGIEWKITDEFTPSE